MTGEPAVAETAECCVKPEAMPEGQLSDVVYSYAIYTTRPTGTAAGWTSDEEVHTGKKWIVRAVSNGSSLQSWSVVTFWIVLLLVLLFFSELPVLHTVRRARTIHKTRAERRRSRARCECKGGKENKDRSKEIGRRIREQASHKVGQVGRRQRF
ncbi:hypothetical protein EDB83DRAFT_2314940 [Lactarius deliciosus]|nr:hypothetical protein EDB83DRAFT_2314940 [Lactarius deliciosus]